MIEQLTGTTEADVVRIGGKGTGLVRLLRAGLPVPDAWVIAAPISLDAAGRRAFRDGPLIEWWHEATGRFPGACWAVRSSAVAEDLAEASFAGVYRTVLGVDSQAGLIDAVEHCWAALDDHHAAVYRDGKGLDARGGIALILQRMLQPDVAGVLLTADPLHPFTPEIVIDASWGLGEAVVSGRTDPDHLVLQRDTGVVRSEHLGAKQFEIVWDGRLVERTVDAGRQTRLCLTEPDLTALHGLARQVESAIGPRRDLEWAIEDGRLYALQDRPITGLPSPTPTNVWSRRFGDEYLAEYTLPLSKDVLLKWIEDGYLTELARLQRRPDLLRIRALRSHNGYAYFSGEYMARMLQTLPAGQRRSASNAWFPPLWQTRIESEPWKPWLLVGMFLAPYRDRGRGRLGRNPEALERHCRLIDATIVPLLRQDYPALSTTEWHRQFEEVNELGLAHFRVIRWGMGHYNPLLHTLLGRLLHAWAGDRSGHLYQAIIGGLSDTRTAELNREIWDLARLALADRALDEALRGDDPLDALRQSTAGSREFWTAFEAFLDRHGHRSSSREISAPRWSETPDVVLGLIRVQLRCDPFPEDPRQSAARARTRRTAAQQTAADHAGRRPLGGIRRTILSKVSRRTQQFTSYRENQRYHLDYLTAHIRQLVLEQGRRLTELGAVTEPFDVFLLSREELFTLVEGGSIDGLTELLDERRRHYLTHRDRLPATFLFDDVETEGETDDRTEGLGPDRLSGLGASRGTAKGPSRVVTGLADLASVQAGDILVAATIDPGWTSVFPLIAGLITETGGVLSHGAILAREYGIPTVTGLKGATGRLPPGSPIEVDGTSGTVRVLNPPNT
jgi:pyruvate,water dikinase